MGNTRTKWLVATCFAQLTAPDNPSLLTLREVTRALLQRSDQKSQLCLHVSYFEIITLSDLIQVIFKLRGASLQVKPREVFIYLGPGLRPLLVMLRRSRLLELALEEFWCSERDLRVLDLTLEKKMPMEMKMGTGLECISET